MYWAMIDFFPRGRNIRNHIAWKALNLIFLPFYWYSLLPINQSIRGPYHQPDPNMLLHWNGNVVVFSLRFSSLGSPEIVKFENVTLTKFWSMATPEMIFLFHWKKIMVQSQGSPPIQIWFITNKLTQYNNQIKTFRYSDILYKNIRWK